jgi:hypothetical protein
VIISCPECGAPGVPLLFGLPVPEAQEAADDGDLALAGCVVPPDPPNWQCADGHQWRDDEQLWNSRLTAALRARGYRD